MGRFRLFVVCVSLFLAAELDTAISQIIDDEEANENDSAVGEAIVGGEQAAPGRFPFFAHWGGCGGTLIAKDYVLTAAHCNSLSGKDILCGAHKAYQQEDHPVNSVWRKISKRIPHPAYNDNNYSFDFMLLKLNEPVDDLPLITLNTEYSIPEDDSKVITMGFGETQARVGYDANAGAFQIEAGIVSESANTGSRSGRNETTITGRASVGVLRKVQVDVIDIDVCNSRRGYNGFIKDSVMICAGVENGGMDACVGDSGGPLIQQIRNEFVQVGVVSFGSGCARADKPGIYSRVSSVYEWIKNEICENSADPPAFCPGVGPDPTESPTRSPTASPTASPTREPTSGPTDDTVEENLSSWFLGDYAVDPEDILDFWNRRHLSDNNEKQQRLRGTSSSP